MRRLLMAGTILSALVMPASAVIVNVGDVGAEGTTNMQGFVDIGGSAVSIPGLTGTLYLQYDGTSNGGLTWNFDYTVTNTSSFDSRISSWGLNTTPNVTAAASTGLFDNALLNPQFPNVMGANVIEMCFTPEVNGCSSGSGLDDGLAASGTFSLTFASALPFISLDAAYFRYQSLTGSEYNLVGASGVGFNQGDVVINPLAVPGPVVGAGLLPMLAGLFGLVGFNFFRKRRIA